MMTAPRLPHLSKLMYCHLSAGDLAEAEAGPCLPLESRMSQNRDVPDLSEEFELIYLCRTALRIAGAALGPILPSESRVVQTRFISKSFRLFRFIVLKSRESETKSEREKLIH